MHLKPSALNSVHASTFTRSFGNEIARSYSRSTIPTTADEFSEEDHSEAREWLEKLDLKSIVPRHICDVTFSRSSGPGGQNVNKFVPLYA